MFCRCAASLATPGICFSTSPAPSAATSARTTTLRLGQGVCLFIHWPVVVVNVFVCLFFVSFCICCNLWQYDDTEDVVVQTNQSFSSCTFFFAASSTTLLSLRTTSWTRTLEVFKIGTASQAPAHCDQLSPWSDSLLGQPGSAVARLS